MVPINDKKTTARTIGTCVAPRIIFDLNAIASMEVIVSNCNEEVGWMGIVDKIGDNEYRVRDIMLPKQEVSGATCELTEQGLSEMATSLPTEDLSKLRFWGHSHHNMGVDPSSQDEDQVVEMLVNSGDFFIRAICNKKGEMSVSFFNYLTKVAIDNIKWSIDDGVDRSALAKKYEQEIKEKVGKFSYSSNNKEYKEPSTGYNRGLPYHYNKAYNDFSEFNQRNNNFNQITDEEEDAMIKEYESKREGSKKMVVIHG